MVDPRGKPLAGITVSYDERESRALCAPRRHVVPGHGRSGPVPSDRPAAPADPVNGLSQPQDTLHVRSKASSTPRLAPARPTYGSRCPMPTTGCAESIEQEWKRQAPQTKRQAPPPDFDHETWSDLRLNRSAVPRWILSRTRNRARVRNISAIVGCDCSQKGEQRARLMLQCLSFPPSGSACLPPRRRPDRIRCCGGDHP